MKMKAKQQVVGLRWEKKNTLSRKNTPNPREQKDKPIQTKSAKVDIKVKTNREIDIFRKMKEVETAQEDLEAVKVLCEKKSEGLNICWETLFDGQKQLEENLVKVDNFVKEKQKTFAAGCFKIQMEKKLQLKREEQLRILRKNLGVLTVAKDCLTNAIQRSENVNNFLQTIVDFSNFQDISELINRYEALIEMRSNLQNQLDVLKDNIYKEDEDLENLRQTAMGQFINCKVRIADFKHEFDIVVEKKIELKRYLENRTEKKSDER